MRYINDSNIRIAIAVIGGAVVIATTLSVSFGIALSVAAVAGWVFGILWN